MKDGVPCLFEMVMDELECSQRSASSLVRDAFGVGEATVSCPRSLITKDMAVATLENLEYYEKVKVTMRQKFRPPELTKYLLSVLLCSDDNMLDHTVYISALLNQTVCH